MLSFLGYSIYGTSFFCYYTVNMHCCHHCLTIEIFMVPIFFILIQCVVTV